MYISLYRQERVKAHIHVIASSKIKKTKVMKTHTTIFIITLMMIAELALAAVYNPNQLSTVKFETTSESKLVKATIVDGELMPVVDLPVVEIIAESKSRIYLPVKEVNGKLIAVIDLPEIEVTETSLNNILDINDEPVAFVDLPEINITGTSLKDNMHRGTMSATGNITLIADLPEIAIYGYVVNSDVQPPLYIENGLSFEAIGDGSESILFPEKLNKLNAYLNSNFNCNEQVHIKVNLAVKNKKQGMVIVVNNEKYFIPGNVNTFKIESDQYIN